MSKHFIDVPDHYEALYRAVLKQAALAGESIMGKVLVAARAELKECFTQARGFIDRDRFELSLKLLDSHTKALCEGYPQALTNAFKQILPEGGDRAVVSQGLRFDQLELMDSAQVQESVEFARSQQSVSLVSDAELSELNTYICATLGMSAVHPESNPIRPEIFVRALQNLLAQTQVPSLVRLDWLQHMSRALGGELSALYKTLSQQLHVEGVLPAGYVVVRTHEGIGRSVETGAGNSPTGTASRRRASVALENAQDSVLTLDTLRRLLAGELDQPGSESGRESFAAQFSREFESASEPLPLTDFEATVPAAFEALKEMKQVDRMVERIGHRREAARAGKPGRVVGQGSSVHEVREQLRHMTKGLGQALSLEVVALMVENIARDARLLDPIRVVIKNLEPALLRLALVDPRFFSDKQHPARCLLQEITHRSLAYDSVESRGFTAFLDPLQRAVGPLADLQIDDAEPFEQVLKELVRVWDERKKPEQLEKAVQALQHAEDRNLLAETIAREIAARPDVNKLPTGLLEFLCGPWAQVIAHAKLADSTACGDPGQYRELVLALVWSAQPDLTSKNIAKLTRLVPQLLSKLREGLHLIDYPTLKTSAFFDLLMKLHQQAFRPRVKAAEPEPAPPAGLQPSLLDTENTWIAPAEAKISGFMEMAPELGQSASETLPQLPQTATTDLLPAALSLPVGAWVELLVNGVWVRTQLSWASPHGSLFLFTSAYGSTQSMTRRSRDKLLAAGSMRIVSDQTVVDGALDAVAQTAMLNSIDVKL